MCIRPSGSAWARLRSEAMTHFADLPRHHFGAILADPPWDFETWSDKGKGRSAEQHYPTMTLEDLRLLPVQELAAPDCVLFLWTTGAHLIQAIFLLNAWGFEYKTIVFVWVKADNTQPDFFQAELPAQMGMGHWSRASSEICLLATRGKPKRLHADVLQAIISPRREHSRKPDCVHERIERLVDGPYLELFARQSTRLGWTFWGNEVTRFGSAAVGA
jgi:N6-adenosine-specific RNA methylase IME4